MTKTVGMRLEAQQSRRVLEHWARIRFGKALATQHIEERLCVPASQVRVGLAVVRLKAEMPPAFDHLLRGATADAELETAPCDEVGRPCVLRHVQRILVTHVDDCSTDLDPLGPGADGSEQRERRGQLPRKVM